MGRSPLPALTQAATRKPKQDGIPGVAAQIANPNHREHALDGLRLRRPVDRHQLRLKLRRRLPGGLSAAEVTLLLDGSTQDAPESEIPALVYARHWAEAAGQPTPELQAKLVAIYGSAQAQAIERVLTMIWIGNLCGNTWDAILFRFFGGRLGQRREG